MQKNDQNPPAKNPSCHVKVQLVCGDGPLYIITFSKKNGILGNADFPPNKHTPTRRHADTPTRRHADRGHAAHTQPTPGGGCAVETTANTHTGRGLRQSRRIAAKTRVPVSPKHQIAGHQHCGSSAYPEIPPCCILCTRGAVACRSCTDQRQSQ